jgi:hypothetical protein
LTGGAGIQVASAAPPPLRVLDPNRGGKTGSREQVCVGEESAHIGRQRDSMAYRTVQIAGRQNMSEAGYPYRTVQIAGRQNMSEAGYPYSLNK